MSISKILPELKVNKVANKNVYKRMQQAGLINEDELYLIEGENDGDVIKGYYYNGRFYTTSSHSVEILGEENKVYIDASTKDMYVWNSSSSQFDKLFTSKQDDLSDAQLSAVNSGITANKVSTYDNYASSKQDKLTTAQLNATNSGITSSKVSTYDGYSSSKQDKLSTSQLNAVNSGITSSKVSTYDGYSSGKQNALSTTQLNAVNSGITSSKVSTYDGYSSTISGKQDKLTSGTNIKTIQNTSILGSGNIDILKMCYPVGSIYMSVNNTNPSTLFGGTWVSWGAGKVPVGVNTSDSDFSTVEKTGGEKTHTLNINEMPAHSHIIEGLSGGRGGEGACLESFGSAAYETRTVDAMWSVGGSQAHNNLQPYITCYMWKRTA